MYAGYRQELDKGKKLTTEMCAESEKQTSSINPGLINIHKHFFGGFIFGRVLYSEGLVLVSEY